MGVERNAADENIYPFLSFLGFSFKSGIGGGDVYRVSLIFKNIVCFPCMPVFSLCYYCVVLLSVILGDYRG